MSQRIAFLQESRKESMSKSRIIGTLHKGEEQSKGLKDLPYFRLDPKDKGKAGEELLAAFKEEYGEQPEELLVFLPRPFLPNNWDEAMFAHESDKKSRGKGLGGTLLRRCNGSEIIREYDEASGTYKSQHKPCQWNRDTQKECPLGCKQKGMLLVQLPKLMGGKYGGKFLGVFQLQTGSWNDILHIPSVLDEEQEKMPPGTSFVGISFRLRRQKESISTPQFVKEGNEYVRSGRRTRDEKYLVKLEMADERVEMAKLKGAREQQIALLSGGITGAMSYAQLQGVNFSQPQLAGRTLNDAYPILPGRYTPQPGPNPYIPGNIDSQPVQPDPETEWEKYLGWIEKAGNDAEKLKKAAAWGLKRVAVIAKELNTTEAWATEAINLVASGKSAVEALEEVKVQIVAAAVEADVMDAEFTDAESADNF